MEKMGHMRFILFLTLLCCTAVTAQEIILTEIMYHPAENDAGNLEFIELYNCTASPLDISGFCFSNGVRFFFPEGTWFESYSYIVVAKDPQAFEAVYGFAPFGPYEGELRDTGERVTFSNDSGRYDEYDQYWVVVPPAISTVDYDVKDPWPAKCNGTGHSLSLKSLETDPEDSENWVPSPFMGGTPGNPNGFEVTFIDTVLVEQNALWRFKRGTEEASTPIEAWRALAFDDSSWEEGMAGFGYGDDDDTTVLEDMREDDPNPGYSTVYIRKKFQVASLGKIDRLTLAILYDDGFVAYLNGHEVVRDRVEDDPPLFNTTANRSHEARDEDMFDLTEGIQYLVEGENVLCVQGHNQTISSPDFSLHPRLIASDRIEPAGASNVVINECYYYGSGGYWLELYNKGDSPADLGGSFLSNDASQLNKYAVPENTVIEPGGFVVFSEETLGFPLEISNSTQLLALFLTEPGLQSVIDAQTFALDLYSNSSMARVPDGTGQWFETSQPTPIGPNQVDVEDGIVINELMFHPFHSVNPYSELADELGNEREYIEIYNRSDHLVVLDGWSFTDGVTYTFPIGLSLASREYLVIAHDPQLIQEIYGLSAAKVVGPFDGRLSNKGERLCLRDQRGNIVDEVIYNDGGDWAQWGDRTGARWADGRGSSLELINPHLDNNIGNAWGPSDDRDKAQWTQVTFSGRHHPSGEPELQFLLTHVGEMLIDDVHVSQDSPTGTNMLSNGGFENGTSNWDIEDGTHEESRVVATDAHSGSNAMLVVSKGHGDNWYNNIEYDVTNPRLYGNRTYHVTYWAKWQRGNNWFYIRGHRDGLAQSYDLVHAAEIPVPDNLGTPGAQNSIYEETPPPVFGSLTQSPAVPTSTEPVVVTCRVFHPAGVKSVRLYYEEDRSSGSSQPMNDAGTGADAEADDGIWSGTIPADFGNRDVILFWVQATAQDDTQAVYPPGGSSEAPVYQVVDGNPDTRLPAYRLIYRYADQIELSSRRAMSNSLIPASFVFNDKTIYHKVGVRYRGSPWIRPGNRGSGYLIRFNSHADLHGRVTELNLDKQHPDGGAAMVRERTAYYLMRRVSRLAKSSTVPYSHQQYVHLLLSGSTSGQLYEHVQRVDNPYLGYWFGEGGNGTLYKADDWFECSNDADPRMESGKTARLTYLGDSKEVYRWYFKLRTNEKWDNYEPLVDLIKTVNRRQPIDGHTIDMAEDLPKLLDVDEWLAILCVRFYIGDWDTIGYNRGKNAYLYKNPQNSLWYLLPWDSDLTFQSGHLNDTIIVNAGTFPTMAQMFNNHTWQRRLYQYYDYLVNGPASEEFITSYWERTYNETFEGETIKPTHYSTVITFMRSRNNVVMNRIGQIDFSIRLPRETELHVTEQELEIEGYAPYNAIDLVINDVSVYDQLSWRSLNRWELDYQLQEGENDLTIKALDADGTELGSVHLSVFYTNYPIPEITSITPSSCSDDALPDGGDPDGKVVATIKGANFLNGFEWEQEKVPPTVLFGEVPSPEVTFVDAQTLEVVVPPAEQRGDRTVEVTVENPDTQKTETGIDFAYYKLWPDIQLIQPKVVDCAESAGVPVTFYGENFSEETQIFFEDVPCTDITVKSEYELLVVPPCEAGLMGDVRVKAVNPGAGRFFVFEDGFAFECLPEITGIDPVFGSPDGGYTIAIEGRCFHVDDGDPVVLFGMSPAEVVETSETRVVVKVPAGSEGPASIMYSDSSLKVITLQSVFTYTDSTGIAFLRGDASGDGAIAINDVVAVLQYLFSDGVLWCEDAADADDNGQILLNDAVYLLQYLFNDGSDPAAPFPEPALDPTDDDPMHCLP